MLKELYDEVNQLYRDNERLRRENEMLKKELSQKDKSNKILWDEAIRWRKDCINSQNEAERLKVKIDTESFVGDNYINVLFKEC